MTASACTRAVGAMEAEGSAGMNRYFTSGRASDDGITVDQHQCPAPPRLGKEMLGQIDEVAGGEIDQILRGGIVRPIDQERLALDVFRWNEAPVAAVSGIIAVIAHGEVMAGRHHHFSVHYVILQHIRGFRRERKVGGCGWEIVTIRVDVVRLVNLVRFVEFPAVQEHLLVDEVDAVAGDADNALHIILFDVEGIAEDDDVATTDGLIREKPVEDRSARRIGHAVDDDVITDEQIVLHGGCRNHLRLRNHAGGENQDDEVKHPLGEAVRHGAGRRPAFLAGLRRGPG